MLLEEVRPGCMQRMDMHSRNEYLKVLRERYLRGCPKTRILAVRGDLNSKGKRVIIGGKRERL
jgi:hypothetical protein